MTIIDPTLLTLALAQSFMVALLVTFGAMPWLIKNMVKRGIVGKDMNKLHEPLIPEMGGIGVVIGYFAGLFTFIAIYHYAFAQPVPNSPVLLAGMFAILGCAFTGAIDDHFFPLRPKKAVA